MLKLTDVEKAQLEVSESVPQRSGGPHTAHWLILSLSYPIHPAKECVPTASAMHSRGDHSFHSKTILNWMKLLN